MSARRRARKVNGVSAEGTPRVLLEAGLSDPLWSDPGAVDRWCEVRGLPLPSEALAPYPRALRDHCALEWALVTFPAKWPGRPAFAQAEAAGLPPFTGARIRARFTAEVIL